MHILAVKFAHNTGYYFSKASFFCLVLLLHEYSTLVVNLLGGGQLFQSYLATTISTCLERAGVNFSFGI